MEGIDMKLFGSQLISRFWIIFGLLFISHSTPSETLQVEPYKEGNVHEAYVSASTGSGTVFRSVSKAPPKPINEQSPLKCTAEAIWIPGYWAWNEELKDYIWISGVWRIPPPNHIWNPGLWKQIGNEWVWLRGFWSSEPLERIQYIQDHPMSPREEAIPIAPTNDYFWMSGYWEYDFSAKQFNWLTGKWVRLDPEWIYTPPSYLWRPEGYIFISAYWDQPLELRGCPYSPVRIDPDVRSSIVYTPSLIVQPEAIIHYCFTYYPDYAFFFIHHNYFHPDFWERWCCTPPWWNWDTCWCFSWHDTWGLWWWWTHPGYPNPHWITLELSSQLAAPSPELINWMRSVVPPTIITPWGAVAPGVLIDAIGGKAPVLPANPEKIQEIYDQINPGISNMPTLEPTGKRSLISMPRPKIGESNFPKELHAIPPSKPIRIPESPVEPPTFVIPKPRAAYPVLPSPPPGYLPAVPKPYYDEIRYEEYPSSYYQPRPVRHSNSSKYQDSMRKS